MKIKGITQKDTLFLAISFFIVVFAWIGFNLYHIWATSTISELLQQQIRPIDRTFDTQTIEQLKTLQKVDPLFEIAGQSSSPSAEIQSTSEATTSAEDVLTDEEITSEQ